MKILTRYILREHVGPFLAAAGILTGLMLLNQVARRFGELAGKGLPWNVIAEVFVLSIPFLLAMTLPMAVLVAVLYTFSSLSSDNEITAIKAGGVSLARMLVPVLLASTAIAAGMTWFNDRVLPESNHALRKLLTDIGRKRPTFQLRERVINEVVPDKLFLQAARIDRGRSVLRDLVIFDMRRGDAERTIYADSGHMAFNETQTDLLLTLYDGSMHEVGYRKPGTAHRTHYRKQIVRISDVSNELERGRSSDWRGDREMNIRMMKEEVAVRREQVRELRDSIAVLLSRLDPPVAETTSSSSLLERTAGRQHPPGSVDTTSAARGAEGDQEIGRSALADARRFTTPPKRSDRAALGSRFSARLYAWPPVGDPATFAARVRSELQQLASRREIYGRDINRYAVEIHKKYSIPVAAIVFVLIGAPIGVRFPRGGVGMVIGVSLAVFCVYWMFLIGGEELADRGFIPPFWSMWGPNIVFGLLGLYALRLVTRDGARRGVPARSPGDRGLRGRLRMALAGGGTRGGAQSE